MNAAAQHPGLVSLDNDAYHRHPALSRSIAQILLTKTPRHAWEECPALNPDWKPKESTDFDIGSALHAVVLGDGSKLRVVVADNWNRKAAQEARSEARAQRQIPCLIAQFDAVQTMAENVRDVLWQVEGIRIDPARSEIAAMAEIDGVQCRMKADNAPADPALPILDVKSTPSVDWRAIQSKVRELGYDLQDQWYREVWKAATGEDRRFIFVFAEKTPPYLARTVNLYEGAGSDADWFEQAAADCAEARQIWRACREANDWPGYPLRRLTLGAPRFHRENRAEREIIRPEPKPSAAALREAYDAQAPFRGAAE